MTVAREELDVQGAVRSLPRVHVMLLRAALIGFNDAELAALVGVPLESVRPLLQVATAKLVNSLAAPDTPDRQGAPAPAPHSLTADGP